MTTNQFIPKYRLINAITNSQYAVVTFTEAHDFVQSEYISFRVSTAYGMIEINNLRGKVLDFDTYTITTDIDSTNFTPFVFPGQVTITNYNSLNLLLNYRQGMTLEPTSLTITGFFGAIWTDPQGDGILHSNDGVSLGTVNYDTGFITGPTIPLSGTYSITTTQANPVCVPVGSGNVIAASNFQYTILNDAFDNIRD